MARIEKLFSALFVIGTAAALTGAIESQRGHNTCRAEREVVRNTDLPEGSGVAASRRNQGFLWAHNDSADPVLLRLDETGQTQGRVRVTGAAVEDWEDVDVSGCGRGTCIYIADIGDNDGAREHISIYRVPEPSAAAQETDSVEEFRATYPDGRHDAESMFVTRDGGIYIVTKGSPGPVALYRFPKQLDRESVMRLERVGEPFKDGDVAEGDRPTGADLSPDGATVALRTKEYVVFFKAADLAAGRWAELSRVDLKHLGEPRGEGIAYGRNGKLFLVGEGGQEAGAGTFAALSCAAVD